MFCFAQGCHQEGQLLAAAAQHGGDHRQHQAHPQRPGHQQPTPTQPIN